MGLAHQNIISLFWMYLAGLAVNQHSFIGEAIRYKIYRPAK